MRAQYVVHVFCEEKEFVVKKLSFIHSKSVGFVLRHIEVPGSLIAIGRNPFGQFLRLPSYLRIFRLLLSICKKREKENKNREGAKSSYKTLVSRVLK